MSKEDLIEKLNALRNDYARWDGKYRTDELVALCLVKLEQWRREYTSQAEFHSHIAKYLASTIGFSGEALKVINKAAEELKKKK